MYLKYTGTLVAVGVPSGPAKLEIPIMLVIAKVRSFGSDFLRCPHAEQLIV